MRLAYRAHRLIVVGLVVTTVVTTALAVRDMHLMPADLTRRFTIGPLMLIYGIYASLIAVAVGWRSNGHAGRRHLSLLLATFGLFLALSIVPSGQASTSRLVLFSAAFMTCWYASFRFWASFPGPMSAEQIEALRGASHGAGGWVGRLNDGAAWAVFAVLHSWWGKGVAALSVLSLTTFSVLPGQGANVYSIMMAYVGDGPDPFRHVLGMVGALSIVLVGAFAWTSYRVADREGRRRALWIVLSHLLAAGFALTSTTVGTLYELTGSPTLGVITTAVEFGYMPIVSFAVLTGFAVATLYSGALDLRPVVSGTTLYGALFLSLTFLFAIVEELVEAVVAERLGLPDGVGGWVGAAVIAIVMGPARTRLEAIVKRFAVSLEASGPAEPAAAGAWDGSG